MKAKLAEEMKSYVSCGNIYIDIGFSPEEALELKVRSEIYRELLSHIRNKRLTQAQVGAALGIHQPDVSHLMTGRVSKFSVGKLIQFAGKLDLDAKVTFHKKKATRPVALKAKAAKTKREAVLA